MSVRLDPGLPRWVMADEFLLDIILSNSSTALALRITPAPVHIPCAAVHNARTHGLEEGDVVVDVAVVEAQLAIVITNQPGAFKPTGPQSKPAHALGLKHEVALEKQRQHSCSIALPVVAELAAAHSMGAAQSTFLVSLCITACHHTLQQTS